MQMHDLPKTRDLVLIGGGHTHALVLRSWAMNPLPGVRVTVINPGPTAPYSGMLPGFVAGHYERDELDIDLVQLARFAGARVILGAAQGIDRQARTIHVPGRTAVAYDVASLDIGITSDMPALPGFADHAVPAKPLGRFAEAWDRFRTTTEDPGVAVIGGGVAGAELAMAMAHALQVRGHVPRVSLIDRSEILTGFSASARAKLLAALDRCGVARIERAEVAEITGAGVTLEDGRLIEAGFVTGAAGARPYGWLADTGLDLRDGFVNVGETLQSSDPAIFAVGDCAHLSHAPRPKAGVFAVREAPVLLRNLRAVLSGSDLGRYRPQKDYLKLISLGSKQALAEKLGTAVTGGLLWRWKDRIDRTFMDKFRALAPMAPPSLPAIAALGLRDALGEGPLCAGCGGKVGRAALVAGLAGNGGAPRDDVAVLPGDDAGIICIGHTGLAVSTDHLRSVTDDPVVMTRIAAEHALSDLWAMGARPRAATISLILPRLSASLQQRTLAEIMETADAVMAEAGAGIVGGHTSMGSDLTIGFTVIGDQDRAPISLAGARDGDVLILTKPIGSGTIMAAEMRLAARGAVVAGALDLMSVSQGAAAGILDAAHAMTDVTGFGLAGHLMGMAEASGLTIRVAQGQVPLMPGALALAEAGIRSSLYPDNRAIGAEAPDTARGALMFDPQTSGGLVAAVPSQAAEGILLRLQEAGYPAARIGECRAGPARVSFA